MSEKDFEDLVFTYQDRVFNTCLGFLKNTEDAKDMAQEVFIQVYRSYDKFLEKSSIGTWIYRISVNKCLEKIRSEKSEKRFGGSKVELDSANLNSYDHPGVSLENQERASLLFNAIDQLPENQKTAFTLNKIQGLSYEEVSKIMDHSLSSVESLIHRGKLKLRKLLRGYYENN